MFKITALALVIALTYAEKESSSRLLLQAQAPPATGSGPALPTITQPTNLQPVPPGSRPQGPVQPAPQQYNPYGPQPQPAYNPYAPRPQQPAYNPMGNMNSCIMMGLDPQDCMLFGGAFGGAAPGGFAHPGIVGNPGPGFYGNQPNYGGYGAQPARPNNPYSNPVNCMAWGLDPQDCMFGGLGMWL